MNKFWTKETGISSKLPFAARRERFTGRKVPSIFMLTYSIPENFGGMTNVLLHRARSFAELGGKQIDVLTIDADMNLTATEQRLKSQGFLGNSNVRLRNLWDEMGELSDDRVSELTENLDKTSFVEDSAVDCERPEAVVRRRDVDGILLQVDRYRSDGTLWAIDRRDTRETNVLGGRRITLYARDGQALAQWTRPSEFYFTWLDSVFGREDAVLISDSQFVGGFIHGYNRSNVVLAQVVHSTHLDAEAVDAYGPLSKGKEAIMRNADAFDLLTVLTDSQRADVMAADLAGSNLRVVPNSRSLSRINGTEIRPNGQGVMISRLTSPKRVEDAVRAATWAHTHFPEINLKIYGEGPKRKSLERLIKEISGENAVSLEGYDSRASQYFRNASFSVLSSKFEGFGLVLVESMAAGCIPISYNINYGPSDIITDGVNGFLVPAGDVHSLAAAIHRIAVMDHDELARMREAAVLRSQDFSDRAIMGVWLDELAKARDRKSSAVVGDPAATVMEMIFVDEESVRIYGELVGATIDEHELFVSWVNRDNPLKFSRKRVGSAKCVGDVVYFAADIAVDRLRRCGPGPLDFSLDIGGGGTLLRRRVRASSGFVGNRNSEFRIYSTVYGNLSVMVG